MPEVQYRIAATENGAALLSGSAPVVSGEWTKAVTIPTSIADGATWWLGERGVKDSGVAEAWKWTSHFVEVVQAASEFPQALGTKVLSARPAWTAAFRSMFGAAHDPMTERGSAAWPAPKRIVRFDDLPIYTGTGAYGTDFNKRWIGYWGNHVGYAGTQQPGDRLVLTEDATYESNGNLDTPRFTDTVEIFAPGVKIRHVQANATTGLMEAHGLRFLGDRQSLPSDGSVTDEQAQANSTRKVFLHGTKAKPLVLETIGACGRTGLNQQGNSMVLVDPFVHDVIVEDVQGVAARAAGFFGYKGRRVWYNRCRSTETWADAYHAANGCEDFLYTDCVAERSGDDGGAPVRYSGESATSSSKRIAYVRHRVITTGHGRGMVDICNDDIYWDQCYIEGSAAAGFLWDREASSATPYRGIYRALAQRMHVKGCNWSEQDHGSVFLNSGPATEEVHGRIESMLIEDAHPNRQVVRALGATGSVLDVVCKDFKAVGGPGNSTWFGGNNLTGVVFDPAVVRAEAAGADTTPPTVVWLAPGRKAAVSGTTAMGDFPLKNGTYDLGNTGAYRNTMLAFYAGHVLGLTSTGVEVHLGDTLLGTVPKSSLDSAGRGYLEGVDYSRFRNGAGFLSLKAVSSSQKTSTTVYRPVTVTNPTSGSLAIVPSAYAGADRVVTGSGSSSGATPSDGGTTPTPTPAGDTTAPSKPTALGVTRPSSGQNVVSWTAATDNVGVAGYNVYGAVSGGTPAKLNTGGLITGTSFTHTGTTNGSGYYYEVEAVDAAGNASASPRPNVSTSGAFVAADTTAPSTPTGVTAARSSGSGTAGTVSWTAATDTVGVTGYHVYWTPSGGSAARLTSSPVTGTSYSAAALTAAAGTVSVEALDAAGNVSGRGTATLAAYPAPDTTAPSAPTALTAERASGTIDLSWTAATDNVAVTGYEVWGTLSGGDPAKLTASRLTTTRYTWSGVTNGSGYYAFVRAYDAAGNYKDSAAITIAPYVAPSDGGGGQAGESTHVRQSSTRLIDAGVGVGDVTLAAAPVAGRLLAAVLAVDKTTGGVPAPSGWTLAGHWQGTDGVGLAMAVKTATASDRTVTWDWGGTGGGALVVAEMLIDNATIDGTPVVSGGEDTVTSRSATSPVPAEGVVLRLVAAGIDSAGSGINPATWPEAGPSFTNAVLRAFRYGASESGNVAAALATQTITSSDPSTVTVQSSAPDQMALIVAKIKGTFPASGGAATRQTMVYGTDKPVAALTGVPAGTVLTDVTGNVYVDAATTYTRKRFLGRVVIRTKGARFEECEFAGPATASTTDDGLAHCDHAALAGAVGAERATFLDCTFRPRTPGNRTNGILGWGFEAYRCDFSRCVDGIGAHGYQWWNANGKPTSYPINSVTKGCHFHDPYFAEASYQGDGFTHNDTGVQVQGGDDGVFYGNWVEALRDPDVGYQADGGQYVGGRVLSCVLFNSNVGTPNGWQVDKNWFDWAHIAVAVDGSTITTGSVSYNRFNGKSSGRDVTIKTSQTGVALTGNTRTDGTAVNVYRS